MSQAAPPQYSADGRWYWDGYRWLPVQPQQTAGLVVQHAGFWLRFLAYLIDFVILWIAGTAVTAIASVVGSALDRGTSGPWSGLTALVALLIEVGGFWLYFSLQESSTKQATLGKLALGIRVVDYEGRRISFGRATGRYFAKILSGLICYIGFFMAGFTERKQALHDLIASTLVVRNRPTQPQGVLIGAAPGPAAATTAVVGIAAAVLILFLTSIVVIVILLTMGGQIQNVFSNVAVALNS